jgi:branched-chain amino acid transport system permease protein
MIDGVQLLQALVNGVGVGLIYGLVGIGFSVIYNASGIINFAQGMFVMLGGMITQILLTSLGLPVWAAAALAVVLVAASGMVLDWLVVLPMWRREASLYAIILATLAAQTLVEKVTSLSAGSQPRSYDAFTPGGPLMIGAVAVSYQIFWIFGIGAVLVLLLWLFFTRTRTGRALRACSQNAEAAALLGIAVPRMLALSFALSAALGAVAGILITPTQYTAYNVGDSFGISGFIAAIIGGFGSPSGALAGGVLLGAVQACAIIGFGAAYKDVASLAVMLLVLLAFPRGVFNAARA